MSIKEKKRSKRSRRSGKRKHDGRKYDQQENAKSKKKAGLVAGVTGNTGYYGEIHSGEYLGKLRGYRGRAVFDEMRRSDPQVKAVLSAITLAIRQAEFYVQPASDSPKDQEIAGVISKNLFEEMTIPWDDVIRHGLLMLPFGFSILEKVWEYRDGLYKLRKLDPRLPQSIARWEYNKEKKCLIGPVQVDTDGVEYQLPIEKILVFTSEREGDNWEGLSILRAAYKPWYLKNDFEKINAIKHDRHGVGIPKAKVPASVREGTREWEDTENALESLYANERSYLIEPEGYEFNLLGGSSKAGTDTLHSIKYYDDMIARSMLAMFLNLGTTETGSRALGMSFIEIFLRSLQAYADYICEIITRFCLREYVDFNWYVDEYPVLKVQQIKELDMEAVSRLVQSGVITTDSDLENSVRSFFRLPEKQETEEPDNRQPDEPPDGEVTDSPEEEPSGDKAGGDSPDEKELREAECKALKLKSRLADEETIPDFIGIEMKLNSAETDLTEEILRLKDDQLLSVIEQLVAGKKVQNVRVPHKKEMYTLCMRAYRKQLKEGRAQVVDELARQKAKVGSQLAEPNTYKEYIDIMSEELMIKIEGASNKLLSTMATSTVELKKRGISGDALRQGLRGKADAKLSNRTWTDLAAGVVNKGWGAGRDIEIKKHAEEVEYCYYSSVLDLNTCQICGGLDGKEHVPGDPGFMTPNPDCLGGDHCRCMTIAVYSREFFDEETYENMKEAIR